MTSSWSRGIRGTPFAWTLKQRVLNLVQAYLQQGVLEESNYWIPEKGTPQGGVWTAQAELVLHPEKTRIVDATQRGGFESLGVTLNGA